MTDRDAREGLFLEHLAVIDRIIAVLTHQRGATQEETTDFASAAKVALVENDFAIIGKFRGESALPTYLTVVITRLYRDYRVKARGRWRPSAAATRLGPVAMRLEVLVHRRRVPLEIATEMLRATGATRASDTELLTLWRHLPERQPLRPVAVDSDPIERLPTDLGADAAVVLQESLSRQLAVQRAIESALSQLNAEDQVILRMRFWEGANVAQIARALSLEEKPLYPRIDQLLVQLRHHIESSGAQTQDARELLGDAS